jgi:hypothetical protein
MLQRTRGEVPSFPISDAAAGPGRITGGLLQGPGGIDCDESNALIHKDLHQ